MVEHQLPKLRVAGSNPVSRSTGRRPDPAAFRCKVSHDPSNVLKKKNKPRSRSSARALRVVELFAGVGGFRVGLERAGGFDVVWSTQWEPGRKKQHASDVYVARFGAEHHVCADIATVKTEAIPDLDLLVGGFPCQDYSVASTL